MKPLSLAGAQTGLVIAAHPDDETIWMGGTLARWKEIDWTIFVLCRKSDKDRMPKFKRTADYYGANGIICDLEDEGIMRVQESIPEIQSIIQQKLPGPPRDGWDVLFTHGANGEYGHVRHVGVHQAVKGMIRQNEIPAKQTLCFAYKLDQKKKIAVPAFAPSTSLRDSADKPSRFCVELSNKEWKAKRNVVKKLYGFGQMSFENRSCAKTELFTSL